MPSRVHVASRSRHTPRHAWASVAAGRGRSRQGASSRVKLLVPRRRASEATGLAADLQRTSWKLRQLHAAQSQGDLATGLTAKTGALFCVACEVHSDTRTRDRTLLPILGDILEELAEGDELDRGGASGLQSAWQFQECMALAPGYRDAVDMSCCPAIIVAIAGPYICFYGAVLVDVFIVQPSMDYIYLGGDPYEEGRIQYAAKILQAVREALDELRGWYQSLHLSLDLDAPPTHLLPHPTYTLYGAVPSGLHFVDRFDYHWRHPAGDVANTSRALFHAWLDASESQPEHEVLHDPPLAPKLHFCVPLLGGVTMVGMDIVPGGASVNAASEYPRASLPRGVVQDVSSALEVLHALGRPVHRHNVMVVKREGRAGAMLVDFYWAGEDGRVRYPA
ncbi:hypothetical protein OH76DRAFT_1554323 [Lentinus brumalis]|uniref:Fungal-type protein kinase domain-containing protein n=1 Tax=Lentinus brumalis TaxID=2498619 RepID=A0A371DHY4_9APHY|nr:hypothetical protein OH76DRAFT_1554323 [Polyporus brumalis]